MLNPERRRWVRAMAWRMRWGFAALFAAMLVRVALPGVLETFGPGEPVVVTTRAVAAGAVLEAGDVKLTRAPPALVPEGALTSLDAAVGQRVGEAVPPTAILRDTQIGQTSTRDAVPAGRVTAAVRLSDPGMAALVSAGDRIDILASAGASASGAIAPAEVLANSALVLDIPAGAAGDASGADSGGGLGGLGGASGSSSVSEGLLLVAVTPEEAALIGGASSWAVITAVLVS
ncbi:MAG: SAF domain-containing protein [Bifidobacteriaceae bacterium]|nr:SAF domain-containing protein [Bifidobacteriaceae bacterium]